MNTERHQLEQYSVEDCLLQLSGLGQALSALQFVNEQGMLTPDALGALGDAVELYALQASNVYEREREGWPGRGR